MDTTTIEPGTRAGNTRIHNTDPRFAEIMEFLTDEAYLLDRDLYFDWLKCVTEDIAYDMPARRNVYREDGSGFETTEGDEIETGGGYYAEDYKSLHFRARQNVEAPSSWYRDPAPRTHRIVSNLIVRSTPVEGEFSAESSILMFANRFDQPVADFITARRQDVIRRTKDGLRLARRLILVDQTLLAQPFGLLFL